MRTLLLKILFLCICSGQLLSTNKLDSLTNMLEKGQVSRKAYYLAEISIETKQDNMEKKRTTAFESMRLAKTSGNKEFLALSNLAVGYYYSWLYYYNPNDKKSSDSSIFYIRKAYSLINFLNSKEYQAKVLTSLGYVLKDIESINYYDQSIKLYQELNRPLDVFTYSQSMSDIYFQNNSNQSGDSVIRIALQYLEHFVPKDTLLIRVINYTKSIRPFNDFQRASQMLKDYRKLIDASKIINYQWDYFYSLSIYEWRLGKFANAMRYNDTALTYAKLGGHLSHFAKCYEMYGIINADMKLTDTSRFYYRKALNFAQRAKDDTTYARVNMNLAVSFMEQNNPDWNSAVKILEENKSLFYLTNFHNRNDSYFYYLFNIVECYYFLGNSNNLKKILDEIEQERNFIINRETIVLYQTSLGRYYYLIKDYRKADENLKIALDLTSPSMGYKVLLTILDIYPDVKRKLGKKDEAYQLLLKWSEVKDSMNAITDNKELGRLQAENENKVERERQIALGEIMKADSKRKETVIIFLIIAAVLLLGFVIIVYRERTRSEKLLLNILPKKIAQRLKKKEKYIAERFHEASVMFIDIANFTKLSSGITPEKLVSILNDIFIKFDELCEKHGLEKIKTIGDCYLAVAGIPEPKLDHARATANMALEVMRLMRDYTTFDGLNISFRIGIDCGPVVAGIIGKNKFIYDLWGDTVNTASRMEDYGVIGEVQVSDRFKHEVESTGMGRQHSYHWLDRGNIEMKGKGQMHTWILRGNE